MTIEFIIFYLFVGITFSVLYKQTAGREDSTVWEVYFIIPLFWFAYLIILTYFDDEA